MMKAVVTTGHDLFSQQRRFGVGRVFAQEHSLDLFWCGVTACLASLTSEYAVANFLRRVSERRSFYAEMSRRANENAGLVWPLD